MSEVADTTPTARKGGASPPINKTNSVVFCFGILACVLFAVAGGMRVMLVMLGGLVVVGALLLGYRQLLMLWQRRKAVPMLRSILGNTAVSPTQISEPARRAKLDDLRRSFENGIDKFRAAGKDLYTLPWYVMVGEPAAGKTEAIRHCNVGFPPGLQDYAQGAGGTINMNWWFTNHAIILDTAGRMIFEEVSPGQSSEWKEFLRLMSANRPNCPINGLLLVVPADSLIKDEAGVIERKAAKIAQQLDTIQRTLGVRFPVFVVVTKCDLINGFREFFDNLDNPQLQHQMLGWSNPSPLDAPFNPEQVNSHLETVRRRLVRRRYTLLLDPVHTEDPNLRRIDQVDALFTFPDSFMAIGPRLKRYMELIFTVGEWSPKPLFLRGIYFTSSMREGSALDAELAEILKVPVESLHEGKVWERERAYFLRDLFVKKVFQEKGLVTRANNSKKLQRRRQISLVGSGLAALLLLGALTWWGASTYSKTLGRHVSFWRAVSRDYPKWKLTEGGGKTYPEQGQYMGRRPINAGEVERLNGLLVDVPPIVTQEIDPSAFAPIAKLMDRDTLNRERGEAYGVVYEACALRPALADARFRMSKMPAADWNSNATEALVEMVRLEGDAARGTSTAPIPPSFHLEPLLKFTMLKDSFADFEKDRQRQADSGAHKDPMDWLYASNPPRRPWPPNGFAERKSREDLQEAVNTFDKAWKAKFSGASGPLFAIQHLREALDQFVAEQEQAYKIAQKPVAVTADYKSAQQDWSAQRDRIDKAKTNVAEALLEVQRSSSTSASTDSKSLKLSELYKTAIASLSRDAGKEYDALRQAATPLKWLEVPKAPSGEVSPEILERLLALDTLLEDVNGFDSKRQPRFQVYSRLYQEAVAQLQQPPTTKAADPLAAPGAADALANAIQAVRASSAEIVKKLENGNGNGSAARTDIAITNWRLGTEIAAKYRRYQIIDTSLPRAGEPVTGEAIRDRIAAASAFSPRTFSETIPLTDFAPKFQFERGYNPDAAKALLDAWAAAVGSLSSSESGPAVLNQNDLRSRLALAQTAAANYIPLYAKYWSQTISDKLNLSAEGKESWDSYFASAPDAATVEHALEQLFVVATDALQTIEPAASTLGAARNADLAVATRGMQESLAAARDDSHRRRSQRLLSTWNANRDVRKARETLLAMGSTEFRENCVVPGNTAADTYWNSYSQRRLMTLAADWNKLLAKKFDESIRPNIAFPLAKFSTGARTLNEREFDALASSIAAFETPGNDKRAPELEPLRRPYNPADDPDWFSNAQKIVAALSTKPQHAAAVSLVGDPRRAALLNGSSPPDRGGAWSDVFVKDRGNVLGSTRIHDPPASDEAAFAQLPLRGAGPVVLEFTPAPNRAAADSVQLASGWPALELLFRANRAWPAQNNPRRWEVELNIKQGADQRSLWLYVDFDKELPSKDAWPSLVKR